MFNEITQEFTISSRTNNLRVYYSFWSVDFRKYASTPCGYGEVFGLWCCLFALW